jgi:hypothetical protein
MKRERESRETDGRLARAEGRRRIARVDANGGATTRVEYRADV